MNATIAHIDYRMRYTSVVMNVTDTQSLTTQQLPGPPKELLSSDVFLLKRLGFAAKDSSHAAFEGTGLSAFHFAVLALLEEDPRETQAATTAATSCGCWTSWRSGSWWCASAIPATAAATWSS